MKIKSFLMGDENKKAEEISCSSLPASNSAGICPADRSASN